MTSTEVTVAERAALALTSAETAAKLRELAQSSQGITAITNAAGRAECHSAAMRAADARIAIAKTGKAARDDATKFSRAVIEEEKRLIAMIKPEEERLLALRDEFDAKVEAEKEAKRKAEAARIEAIKARVAELAELPAGIIRANADAIREAIANKELVVIDDSFGEFFGDAGAAKASALTTLRQLLDARIAQDAEAERRRIEQEQEAARLKAEREKLERQRQAAAAEAAERQRLAEIERKERARVDSIKNDIAMIKSCPARSVGSNSAELRSVISRLWTDEYRFGEFAEEAQAARAESLAALNQMLADRLELEAARKAAAEAAAAKAQAEKSEAARKEREAKEAAERAAHPDAITKQELAEIAALTAMFSSASVDDVPEEVITEEAKPAEGALIGAVDFHFAAPTAGDVVRMVAEHWLVSEAQAAIWLQAMRF